jgi:Flp pilus assembly protein TadD
MARTKASFLPTIESSDRRLASAIAMLAISETAENHRAVAAAYHNAGVLDYAYRHFQRALKLEPCDSAAYEGIARLWREWGRSDLALGDAYRAIHCRPRSASAYNTLGTVFLSLGQRDNARGSFEAALRLDSQAAFALNNLCYLSVAEGNGAAAQRACERALALDPTMPTARTNLALAYALQGDRSNAERRLLSGSNVASGHFNVGILRMSLGLYEDAAESFELALKAQPNLSEAARRAVQARTFAASQKEP